MPRKARTPKPKPTDAQVEGEMIAAHQTAVAEHIPEENDPATEFDIAKLEAMPPSPPVPDREEITQNTPEPTQMFPTGKAEPDTQVRVEAALAAVPQGVVVRGSEIPRPEPLAGRDWAKYADPAPRHSVRWPDGFEIAVQESPSRKTVEIQFGDGSTRDKPQNYDAIKEVLREHGMRWNGTNAWVVDLVPERGSHHEKLMARDENKAIRTRIEDEAFPQIIAVEEEKRGQIELTDETRQRINRAAEVRGRS
ncbi:MAG: hypothetical protein K8U57_35850 [Planctomycetes bacterium]|nr:hypothetical protein [Planctomycetota bacterium]